MRQISFERDGVNIVATVRDGDGSPLIIVPGVMSDMNTWQAVVDAITLPNPVVVMNRRGRLPSDPIGPKYSLRTEIDDLHRLIDIFDSQVELFGWSYGGLIALESAIERSDLHSLVLYEPVVRPFALNAVAPIQKALSQGDLDRAVELVNTDVSGFSREYVDTLRKSPVWKILRPLAIPLGEELAIINNHEPNFNSYSKLTIPITLLLGELNENKEPYGTAFTKISQALPQAQVMRLAEQGHLAHAQAPALLGTSISRALAPNTP